MQIKIARGSALVTGSAGRRAVLAGCFSRKGHHLSGRVAERDKTTSFTDRSNSSNFTLDRDASCCNPATMLYDVCKLFFKIEYTVHERNLGCPRVETSERIEPLERDGEEPDTEELGVQPVDVGLEARGVDGAAVRGAHARPENKIKGMSRDVAGERWGDRQFVGGEEGLFEDVVPYFAAF
jgi:hypothetical protein